MKLIYNERLPEKLRRALLAEARRRDTRMNNVAGAILAERYGMIWEDADGGYRVEKAKVDKIKVPDALHRRIRQESLRVRGGGTMRGIVLTALADELGVKIAVSKQRRPRKEPS